MKSITWIVVFLLCFGHTVMADDIANVSKLVKEKTRIVIDVLRNKNLQQKDKDQQIIDALMPVLDFKFMAKISLGKKYWPKLKKVKKKEFSDLFISQLQESLAEKHAIQLSIDLKPALDHGKLDLRLQKELAAQSRKEFKTILKSLLPKVMIPVCIQGVALDGLAKGHEISAPERKRLRLWLKELPLIVTRTRAFNEAIITAGGVDTQMVDSKTMLSRKISNLFFAGEVLDIDADTGGYNLQAAFSTGWLAAESAVNGS